MTITFHPKAGAVLICDFDGFKSPEMVKKRPVIVVSHYQLNKKGLCTVIPLSTTRPNPVEAHHYQLMGSYPFIHPQKTTWVKCDMIYRVSFSRLDRIKIRGKYQVPVIAERHMKEIISCLYKTLQNF